MTTGDLLRKGSQWLEQMRTTHCSSLVEYRQPPQVVTVNATYGQTQYEIASDTGATVGAHVWDFLITASELPEIEPEPGDVIAADGRQYEVMAFGDDVRGWRWSDPYRQTYRIHTKDIGVDA